MFVMLRLKLLLTFGVLYCFFVIARDRRRIRHLNVTQRPTGLWITQQLREASLLMIPTTNT